MKSSAKRLLAMLIVLAMALSLMPMMAFAADTTTLYVKPNTNWLQGNARFAAYFFGAGEVWADCSDADGDGIYEVTVPEGGYTHIIFCRMNPNAAANNWNNKWNQTKDLPLADTSAAANCYVVAENTWDNGNGQWVAYTVEGGADDTEPTTASPIKYSVAGEATLCGSGWDPSDINNMMLDEDGDGIYSITYENVAAGTYEFKVTDGTWTNSWGKPNSTENYQVTVVEADSTVEILFNEGTQQIEVKLNNEVTTTESTEAGEVTYYVAGTFNEWNCAAEGYMMTEVDGIYSLTIALTAGDHALKVTDGTWNNSWGGTGEGGNYVFATSEAGEVTVSFDGVTVTVTGEYVVEAEKEELVINSIHAVGAPGLTGADWDPAANEMELIDGFYVITFENVAAGTYEFKFAANGAWDLNWTSGVPMESTTVYDAWFNAMGNSSVVIPADGATVTLMLDLNEMDIYTGEGGQCAVIIEGVEPGPGPEPVPGTYYVAGSFNEWNCAAEGYMMTEVDGIYSLTIALTAGSYSLKVTDGTWDNSWGGTGEGGNYDFVVEVDGEVTVTFDGETVTVSGDCLGEIVKDPLSIEAIYAVGAEGLMGVDWDPTANMMTNVNGVYTITFENVAAGTYEFKFVANGTWELNWASGIAITSGETQTAWKNAMGNSSIEVAEDGSNVVLIFDTNTMDIYTGEGATMKAMIIVPMPVLGATVSGAVVSGAEGDVTIELIADGEIVASVTASGKEGTYSIVDVAAGTYTLKVSQLNHVTREYTVTVGEEDLTQDVKIHLIGDIDGNGKVNVGDVSKLNSHLKGTNKLTDEYMILCANVNGGSLNMGDTAALYGHIKGTKPLY